MGGEQEAWLPVGWKMRVRVRTYGRKDKYYVNPSNGLKFSSKPEVLRYLTSSGKDRKSKELAKIDKKTVAEQLPPGWIKKIQTKKKGNKMRRDLCYIDPVSGRHFRSIPQAIQYIESMDSGEVMPKLDAKGHVTVELGNHSKSSSGEAKGQRSIDKKTDTDLTQNRSVKPGMKTRASVAMKNMNILEDNHLEKREDDSLANGTSDKLQRENRMKRRADKIIEIKKLADSRAENKGSNRDQRSKSVAKVVGPTKVDMPVLEQIDQEDGFVAGNLPNKSQVVATERANGTRRRSMRLSNSKQNDNLTEDQSSQLGSIGSAGKSIFLPESNDSEQVETENNSTCEGRQPENLASQNKRKTPIGKCASDLPRRTSKRLARVKPEHSSPEIKTSNKSGVPDTLSGESEVTAIKKVSKDGPLDDTPLIDDPPTGKISNDSRGNSANYHDSKEDVKHSENHDSSLKLTDPCIEFAVKTLTGAIPIEEEVIKVGGDCPVTSLPLPNQASASSSSAHIWADPCFEFAVKMLTEDVSPSSYSFNQFDAANKKPILMRQGVKDPPFPRAKGKTVT